MRDRRYKAVKEGSLTLVLTWACAERENVLPVTYVRDGVP